MKNTGRGGGVIMSVPNQKLILIDKTSTKEKNFFLIPHEVLFAAMRRLTLNGIRVYTYFMSLVPDSIDGKENKNNIRNGYYELSTSHAAEIIGSDTKSVQRGVEDLIKNGYLISRGGNKYQFIDMLPEDKTQTPEEHEKINTYQEELRNSLQLMSGGRDNQLKQIARRTLEEE